MAHLHLIQKTFSRHRIKQLKLPAEEIVATMKGRKTDYVPALQCVFLT